MKTKLFHRLVAISEENRLRYALLGNTDAYPEAIGSDVDVMIHPEDCTQFHHLIWGMEDARTRIVQMLQHETVAFYYVVAQVGQDRVCMLQPDVCTDYYRNGVKLLSAEELLQDTVYATDEAGQSKGFRVLAPAKAFIYYLLKKIDKATIDEVQFTHLRAQFLINPGGASDLVRRFWSDESLGALKRAFDLNDLAVLQHRIPLLRHELHRSLSFSLKDSFKRFLLRVRRCLHPTGFVIQIEPGGESADTLARELFDHLGGAFRRQAAIKLSKTRCLSRLVLPASVLRARICSTLVVLLGERKPWLARVDARIVIHEGRSKVFLSTCRVKELEVPARSLSSLEFARVLLDTLSQRTRARCLRLFTKAPSA